LGAQGFSAQVEEKGDKKEKKKLSLKKDVAALIGGKAEGGVGNKTGQK